MLLFGGDAVNAILSVVPAWVTSGLSIAGGILPVIGMAALLSYMPVKQYASFLVVGFALSAYFGVGILPIAMIGGAAAYEVYKRLTSTAVSANALEGGLEDE